jgi:hypothetical protein
MARSVQTLYMHQMYSRAVPLQNLEKSDFVNVAPLLAEVNAINEKTQTVLARFGLLRSYW